MVPLLVGIGIGIVADELLSDDKKELQTSTDRKQISASDVPEDIRRQIEGESSKKSLQNICEEANKFYYGLFGYVMNKNRAFSLYKEAAAKGHSGAKNALKTLYNYNY